MLRKDFRKQRTGVSLSLLCHEEEVRKVSANHVVQELRISYIKNTVAVIPRKRNFL